MTIRTIRTNEEEAMDIMSGRKRYIFRTDREVFNRNELIEFVVFKDGKRVKRGIDDKTYVITLVQDYGTAPVEKGFQLIAFRECD